VETLVDGLAFQDTEASVMAVAVEEAMVAIDPYLVEVTASSLVLKAVNLD
jgi:hypothetical protein